MVIWDSDQDWRELRDSTGSTPDNLGGHSVLGSLDHGYEYGSLTRGLVAYYPFDGDVNDATPLGNDGTDNTSAGYNGSGQVGSDSKLFDGTDDNVTLPSFSLSPSAGFTISFWVQFSDATDQAPIEARNSSGILIRTDQTSTDSVDWYDGSGYNEIITTLSTGQWYHIAITSDGSSQTAWLDGSQANTSSTAPSRDTSRTDRFGEISAENSPFNGMIDDGRFYDRALSQPEIEALSNVTQTQTVVEADVL